MKVMRSLSLFLAVIFFIASVGTWISIPDEKVLNITLGILTLVLAGVGIVLNRERFSDYYKSTHFYQFVSTLVSLFLICCILGFVNFLSFKNTNMWDFSFKKLNSLSAQSLAVLDRIDEQMKVTIFAQKKDIASIRKLVDFYRVQNKNISIHAVDVEINPTLVQMSGIKNVPSVLFEYKGRKEIVERTRELEVTNGLIRVMREKNVVIRFVTGHGIAKLNDQSVKGLLALSNLVKKSSYDLIPIDLLQSAQIPEATDVLVIWGPKEEFTKIELAHIDSFIKRGGNLLVAMDPGLNGDTNTALRDLLISHGIRITNNLVIDAKQHVNGSKGTAPLINSLENHPMLGSFSSPLFFPLVSAVEHVPSKGKGKFKALFKTSKQSWIESDAMEIVQDRLKFNKDKDRLGPFALAASFEKENGSKIIALGNSSNSQNMYSKFVSNHILFLNSLAWLSNEDQIAAFNQPVIEDKPVFISRPQLGVIFYSNVVIVPLMLIFMAIFIYRRNRVL